jgi:hypothetical protein
MFCVRHVSFASAQRGHAVRVQCHADPRQVEDL